MTNLTHHYKDREPEETIQIIKKFFNNLGLQIYTNATYLSEANTYSTSFRLEYEGHDILHTNGKGLSPIYAEASGLSELYERFCAYPRVCNLIMQTQLRQYNKAINNYELSPDEKELSILELVNNPYIYYQLSHLLPEVTEEYIQKYLEIYCNNKYIGRKYINIENNQDIIYQDLSEVFNLVGTTGLAAGNNLEEALVQGISEFFERLVIRQFCNEKSNLKNFYYINNSNLPQEIKERVQILESLDYLVRLYDLSYTYGLPVCMLYMCKKSTNIFHICFGAAPTFSIAAERCLTEIYQGTYRLPWWPRIIVPSENCSGEQLTSDYYTSSHMHDHIYIHELCMLHSKEIDSYNKNIFLDDNEINQKDLLNHVLKLAKLNNLNLYYTNISLSDQMTAIHIMTDNIILNQHEYKYEFLQNFTKEQQIRIFDCFYTIVKYGKKILLDKQNNQDDLENLIRHVLSNIQTEEELNGLLCYLKRDVFTPYSLLQSTSSYQELFNIILNKFENIQIKETFGVYNIYLKYSLYFEYLQKGYSYSQIKEIFNTINFQIEEYSLDDFTPLFLINKIFIEPLVETYNSSNHDLFIKVLIKND